jgi:hypothetical protein
MRRAWRTRARAALVGALAALSGACAVYAAYVCADAYRAAVYGRVGCTARAHALIEQSRSARAAPPPARPGRARHVVFSAPADAPRRDVERAARRAWRNVSAQVAFEVFGAGGPAAPDLPSMYALAEALHPAAQTYTFVRADCASNASFVETLDALLALGVPFLAAGRRTSVRWARADPPATADFDGLYRRGAADGDAALAYFAVSRGALRWRDDVPPVHPGHPDGGLWLLNYALHRPDVLVVDVTRTVPMLHLLGAADGRRRPDRGETTDVAACEIAMHRGRDARHYYKGHTLASAPMYSRRAAGGIEIDHAGGVRPVNAGQIVAVGLKRIQ